MKKARILSIILIITLIILPIASFAQPSEDPFVYTALGDSIAYGTGASLELEPPAIGFYGYTDMLAEHFDRTQKDVVFFKIASDGLTSEDLLSSLADQSTILKIQSSDVITISVGGNDLLQPIKSWFLGMNTIEKGIVIQYLNDGQMNSSLEALISDLIDNLGENLITNFSNNLGSIITKIKLMNPNVKIYVNNLYEPFKQWDPFYGIYQLIHGEKVIEGMNLVIHSGAMLGYYEEVDVYSKYNDYNNPKKLLVNSIIYYVEGNPIPMIDFEKALHPTDKGYKFIFNLHKDQL